MTDRFLNYLCDPKQIFMNPFRYANIAEGEFFYDRKEELTRVVQTLEGGNNLVLYAPRRYGKSSLINKALIELKQKGFKTVYLDFMSIYSTETTRKYDLGAVSSTQKALEVLIEQGIVDKTDRRYIHTDPIFVEFIKQNL